MPKFILEFSSEATEVVNNLAEKNHSSKSEVIRRALNLLNYVEQQQAENAKILILAENGEAREIVPL